MLVVPLICWIFWDNCNDLYFIITIPDPPLPAIPTCEFIVWVVPPPPEPVPSIPLVASLNIVEPFHICPLPPILLPPNPTSSIGKNSPGVYHCPVPILSASPWI